MAHLRITRNAAKLKKIIYTTKNLGTIKYEIKKSFSLYVKEIKDCIKNDILVLWLHFEITKKITTFFARREYYNRKRKSYNTLCV